MAQTVYPDLSFSKNFKLIVKGENNIPLKYPWVGGLNSCQFSTIDLNNDGIKDLFVFDRHGNKILTFINTWTSNTIDYIYAPQYETFFPDIHDWVMLLDYNNDGKEDLFTYANGGISVYKNISDNNSIQFKLITPLLRSLQGKLFSNLLVTNVDYPAITDLDHDGDLDILTFFGLGSFVQYHKNMSMEKYGNSDSLDYVMRSSNWGNFAESPESNKIKLDTVFYFFNKPKKHTGSTFLAFDSDNDQDMDLILGDVDYPNLVKLNNGGTKDSAHIINRDSAFPSNTQPVHMFSFPQPFYIDIDNDQRKDLLVSPFEPGLQTAENFKSIWLYKNIGTKSIPVFTFQKNNFLQDDMIDVGSGAMPVLYDFDHDGLKDLFISNYGYYDTSWYDHGYLNSIFISKISLYKNTGTWTLPEFTLVTNDFADLSNLKLNAIYPTFGDINHDGKSEMLIGNSTGNILYFSNNASTGQSDEFVLADPNFQKINVGEFSTPQLFDLNQDSIFDLVIGERKGKLHYYENTGTKSNPVFKLKNDSLGKVDVTNYKKSWYGYSIPCFIKNSHDSLVLFTGCENGNIGYYKHIENNLNNSFELGENNLLSINEGIRTSVAIDDIDHDGLLDMFVGNYRGGLSFYKGDTNLIHNSITETSTLPCSINIFPNPANDIVTIQFEQTPTDLKNLHISVFNTLNQIVFENKMNESNSISISTVDYPQGFYAIFITGTVNGKVKTGSKKLIVRH